MHLKHACLPISPPEQVENEVYFIIFIGHAQGGIFIFLHTPIYPICPAIRAEQKPPDDPTIRHWRLSAEVQVP